jgi:hypothetical protein
MPRQDLEVRNARRIKYQAKTLETPVLQTMEQFSYDN